MIDFRRGFLFPTHPGHDVNQGVDALNKKVKTRFRYYFGPMKIPYAAIRRHSHYSCLFFYYGHDVFGDLHTPAV